MRHPLRASLHERRTPVVALFVLAFLGGCQAVPTGKMAVPEPALQLLDAQPLSLAADCRPAGSVFVEYTVRTDGRTEDLRLPAVSPCVRDALVAWVSSFRYAPLTGEASVGIEWMTVTARKGS